MSKVKTSTVFDLLFVGRLEAVKDPETVKKMGQKSYRIFSDEYSLSQCLTKINSSYLELLD